MKKRILSIGLCLSILTTMIMNNNNSVFAITSDEASQKGFTVDITKGSVYYGKDKDNNPALYRVVYSNASTVTLLYHGNATDKGNFINKEFDASSYNMWENSVACMWLNDDFLKTYLTNQESAALANYGTTETYTGGTIDISQKVVIPSTTEVNHNVGTWGMKNTDIAISQQSAWLRSPLNNDIATDKPAYVSGAGWIQTGEKSAGSKFVLRPTFKIDLSSVIFTTDVNSGKISNGIGADALAEFPAEKPSIAKLTIKDTNRNNFKISTLEYDKNNLVISVGYSGAAVGDNEYVSAVIKNSSGVIKYYGKLAKPENENGTVTINLSGKLNSDDKLYLFSEQCNANMSTDYASELREVSKVVSTLSELKYSIDGGVATQVPDFTSGVTDYELALPKGTSTSANITFAATPTDSEASISENNGVTLVNGTGVATIKVTGAGGENEKIYTIKVGIFEGKNATLSKLSYSMNGGAQVNVPEFTSIKESYNIELPVGTNPNSVISLNGELSDENANIISNSGIKLVNGRSKAIIKIVAEDGKTFKTYSLYFNVKKSQNAELSALSYRINGVGNKAIANFNTATRKYDVKLPKGTEPHAKITLDFSKADLSANIRENDGVILDKGKGKAIVIIAAEDGKSTKVYTVNFSVEN